MPCPENSICIVIGEMNMVVTAMRRSNRWSHVHQEEEQDSLLKSFNTLKETINSIRVLDELEAICYLSPFLDVIRSENTSGLVTGHGLSAVYKFLSYGLIDISSPNAAVAAENIADAVTHARFMVVDSSSDEVVLMKIIQVLRLLLLTSLGTLLTNESVCEIIQSFFRMCFETRCSEILRRTAESALIDTVQLLFSRLPQFPEDLRCTHVRKLKMRSNNLNEGHYYKRRNPRHSHSSKKSSTSVRGSSPSPEPQTGGNSEMPVRDSSKKTESADTDNLVEDKSSDLQGSVEKTELPAENKKQDEEPVSSNQSTLPESPCPVPPVPSMDKSTEDHSLEETVLASETLSQDSLASDPKQSVNEHSESNTPVCPPDIPLQPVQSEHRAFNGSVSDEASGVPSDIDYVNPRGVRFTPHQPPQDGCGPLMPYGLPCVRELFRLLISLVNPHDRHNNTEMTIQIGLSLLTISLEAGVDHLGRFKSLLSLVKDEMCRNLFSLLSTERLTTFASALRVFFLLFEALRTHLKFQLEMFLQMLMDIIVSESSKVSYEQREMALDCITQLWRIPGLVTELYINYDSDLYCSNLFEDLTKLLSKNAFPLSGLYSVHLLSLDALLAVVDNIESHCHSRLLSQSKFCPEKELSSPAEQCGTTSAAAKSSCVIQETASGYLVGQQLLNHKLGPDLCGKSDEEERMQNFPCRMKISSNIPSHEELMAIKHKKKILASGTEQFNMQPSKGISFLQDHGLLKKPLDPEEVASFLRDNPQLDKKMIGEYISNRKNLKVLEAFVRSFSFENTRIDEALRQYLETFRLPGEAPLISLIMEHFAEHWHNSNKQPFANSDAAFTLAYAIIILNVDQHNHNVKKQNNPMTLDDFKKNLKNVNGGKDFDDDLLEKIYTCIRNEEIVMPAEQTGLVKENYLWKVLLRRGSSKEGKFIHAPDGIFDHDLFSLVWGPTVAALSFIFDKSSDSSIIEKTIGGFHKCAMIAAHYGMSDVFDNLVISLCKFTCLVNTAENSKMLPVNFGNNTKAQVATKALFRLAHSHGDIIREGWKNLLDCILHLFKAKLLPEDMVEAEDFVNPNGVISLIREDVPTIPRIESGLLSSFYSYITSESPSQRALNQEDEIAKQTAIECIKQCHCEQLFAESKFLRIDSLQELVKTLIFVCPSPDISTAGQKSSFDEDAAVFVLEILIKIVLLNRDRVISIWTGIQEHLFSLVVNAAATECTFLLERTVVGILRITVRLVRKEEMIPQVMQALRVLLLLKMSSLMIVARQIAYALHELLRTNAANIHSREHWSVIFTLLERVGAAAKPSNPAVDVHPELGKIHSVTHELAAAQSDSELSIGRHNHDSGFVSERGYTSDSELYDSPAGSPYHGHRLQKDMDNSTESVGSHGTWIMVNRCDDTDGQVAHHFSENNQYDISLNQELLPHDFPAFIKSCETLAFLVRDAAHITEENFESCVHCIRIFLEASANEGIPGHLTERKVRHKVTKDKKGSRNANGKRKDEKFKRSHSHHAKVSEGYDADDEEKRNELSPAYQHASMQLLDLMHTLHTRASSIFGHENQDLLGAEQSVACRILWSSCWCPLLQGIAWLCCDSRRAIRTSALTLLPRALLIPDMQALAPAEWEACFNKVLFPLLSKLLENISPDDPIGMEETRMRGATLLCKVFLQHLTPLLTLPTFMALWLTILDFMDKYMHADGSGLLAEAIPESLKNMLLVMDTAGVFQKHGDKDLSEDHVWNITWDRINTFLPGLKNELFRSSSPSFMQPVSSPVDESKAKAADSPNKADAPNGNLSEGDAEKPVASLEGEVTTTSPSVSITIQEDALSVPPAVILHPPVSSPVYTVASKAPPVFTCSNLPSVISSPVVSPTAVPLLLNPSVMNDSSIPMFNTQV